MSVREKQRAQLSTVEAELRRRLIDSLKLVARGEDSLFFTTAEFNPFGLPTHMLSKTSAELSELAAEALQLRDLLGESPSGSVAEMFRGALREAADVADQNRLGPARSAMKLLDRLGNPQPAQIDSTVSHRLEPVSGWSRFSESDALVEFVSRHLSSWHYLSFTSDTSTWENPSDGCLVNIAFTNTESVREFSIVAPVSSALKSRSVSRLLEHLRDAYGVLVQPLA